MNERALELYSGNHLIRALIKNYSLCGIPVGELIDSLATEAYNKLHVERAAIFFEELDRGNIELSQEVIQSEEFLFSLFAALKASLYTRQKEKVRFFAKLFAKHLTKNQFSQADEYDGYLKILDGLTFREIYMLYRLKQYEDTAHLIEVDEDDEDKDDELRIAGRYWRDFSREMHETLGIEYPEIAGLLTRAGRTGCYAPITSMTLGCRGDRGKTTRVFEKLAEMIGMKQEDFPYYRNAGLM
ncbi:hypothetical protein CSV61_08550 [Sporosarcina sp. P3]|uniref:hypothetical protein n=1 Tax=Sporosarcina sp. P3 TaxID=2048245 RepID=UPI000C171212|nr:hypothetical protein [Sporosarcina sp. P3]PID21740.1 hypothetical protein CSV61_08550 [Sporosarcina sp. P3]